MKCFDIMLEWWACGGPEKWKGDEHECSNSRGVSLLNVVTRPLRRMSGLLSVLDRGRAV